MRILSLSITVFLLLAGCGGVVSEHPLSDKTDSVVDARLIGWWADEKSESESRLVVGRVAGDETALEVVQVGLDREQRVDIKRARARCVELAGGWHLSLSEPSEKDFFFFRYSIEGRRLSMQYLDEERVARAIERGEIEGRVKRDADGDPDEVRLTASTAALRAWLAKTDMWNEEIGTLQRQPIPVPERASKK